MEKDKLTEIFINCYRKFKSNAYYSANHEYLKPLIAEFEYNDENMNLRIDDLATALLNNDSNYFGSLYEDIVAVPFIKHIKTNTKEDDKLITNLLKEESIIADKINFFIKMPVELFIIDTFWSLLYASTTDEKYFDCHCYANKIAPDVLDNKSGDLLDKINFKSLSIFSPYYSNYKRWKNDAIQCASSLYDNNIDSTVCAIDLTRYFYNVNINFSSIFKTLLNCNHNYSKYEFLHSIEESIYSHYSAALRKFDKRIDEKQIVLPIGLVSSCLLSNYYLSPLDKTINQNNQIVFYGRYVDDMLFVVKERCYQKIEDIVHSVFPSLLQENGDDFELIGYDKCKIQKDKVKLFCLDKNGSRTLLDQLSKESFPASEPRLFPNYSFDLHDFLGDIYKKQEFIKFREIESATLDVKRLITSINGYFTLRKSTTETTGKKNSVYDRMDNDFIKNMKSILTPSSLIPIYNRWNKLLLFLSIHKGNAELMNSTKSNINKAIAGLTLELDKNEYKNGRMIKSLLKDELKVIKELAIASCEALLGIKNANCSLLAKKLRSANLIDQSAIAAPLVNYLDVDEKLNYYESKYSDIAVHSIDKRKIRLSPRFIHSNEYIFLEQLKGLLSRDGKNSISNAYSDYYDIASAIFGVDEKCIDFSTKTLDDKYKEITIKLNTAKIKNNTDDHYIALANINLEKHKIVKKKAGKKVIAFNNFYLVERKAELIKLLNTCNFERVIYYPFYKYDPEKKKYVEKKVKRKSPVEFIVFPEMFLPLGWIGLLEKYSRNTGVTIITGLKPFTTKSKRYYNLQAVIVPYKDKKGHKSSITILREKNNYAPAEKEIAMNTGLTCIDASNPTYFKYCYRDLVFVPFICYELTDIYARSLIRPQTDVVFSCENNLDVKYFSNIAEATSRDLSCFVIQVNSSTYGDTRIIAPYRDKCKTIAAIHGGVKDSTHIDKIDVNDLHRYLSEYASHEVDNLYSSLDSKDKNKKYKKPSAGFKI